MSTINASCAGLPSRAKKRLFAEYLRQSSERSNSIHLIGGELGAPMILEDLVRSQGLDYKISVNGDVCVLAKSSDDLSECYCFPVEFSTAHAVVTQLWEKRASARDSDAHPVRLIPRAREPTATHEASDSDAHPVRVTRQARKHDAKDHNPDSDEHPARFTLQARTPLWDKFAEKLDLATSIWHGRQFMKFIEDQCFFGELCFKNSNGDNLKTPMPLGIKMECLLETAAKRRQLVLDRLRGSAAQPVVDTTHEIEEDDMRTMWQRGSPERDILSLGVMGGRSVHKNGA